MPRLTPKLVGTAVAALLTAGLLIAATAAYASGSSCHDGSCEQVIGSGLHIDSTYTYANSPHCSQSLNTVQYDQKGLISRHARGSGYIAGCSTYPWNNANGSNYNLSQGDNFYGQSYFNGAWQGIATVNIHS
jgi:hypothetical protein